MAQSWSPTLEDCARHIPERTRDTKNPGSDEMLGTFTAGTTPDAGEAQAFVDAAVRTILSQTGPLDESDPELLAQARGAAEWRAAADIELSYPNRDADVHVAMELDGRAKYELATLLHRLQALGEGYAESAPAWSAPDPPPWADQDPDYRPRWSAQELLRYWGSIDRGPV